MLYDSDLTVYDIQDFCADNLKNSAEFSSFCTTTDIGLILLSSSLRLTLFAELAESFNPETLLLNNLFFIIFPI